MTDPTADFNRRIEDARWTRVETKLDQIAEILAKQSTHERLLEQHTKLLETMHLRLEQQDRMLYEVNRNFKFAKWVIGIVATALAPAAAWAAEVFWHRLNT